MKIKIIIWTIVFFALSGAALAQSKKPAFKQFAARVETVRNIAVDLKSHRSARRFRTNLREAAKEGVNFAGRFVLTSWGCGTNCMVGALIDARTGRVFFPPELEGIGVGFCDIPAETEPLVFEAGSRLLVLSGYKGGDLNRPNAGCGTYYLEWTGGRFRQVRFDRAKRTDTP